MAEHARSRGARPAWWRFAARALLVLSAVVLVAILWFILQVDPVFSSRGREVVITVRQGDTIASIAAELHEKGVIASPLAFRLESLVLGAPVVDVGSYELPQRSSFAEVRAVLSSAPNVASIDAEAGLTLREIATNLAQVKTPAYATAFLADAKAAAAKSPYEPDGSLEGLVGDRTYLVTSATTPKDLVRQMTRAFEREAREAGLTPTSEVAGLRAYQLVIAASIVQKEGYYVKNMPKVARVIFNRLARGSPLQMDSTVLYYLGQDGGTVTHAMEETPTPYNTYLHTGLTPTPICTVSRAALRAVLHAPPGPWLYFTLMDKQGDMKFVTTFAQQLRDEAIAAKRGVG